MENFDDLVQKAIKFIDDNKLSEAEECVRSAAAQDISAPQAHNLYGIISEYRGDILLAAKHYRASYALEPSYKPALRNLDRVTSYYTTQTNPVYDVGNTDIEVQKSDYEIEYEPSGIGRVKKKR